MTHLSRDEQELLERNRSARLERDGASLTGHHFAEQRDFYRPRKRSLRDSLCSRRAGKTRGGNESDVELASRTKNGRFLYVNETRAECKRLAWIGARGDGMASLVRDHKLDAVASEAEMTIHFPKINSWIYLIGVDDERAITKALGMPWHRVRWDEAQRIPPKFTPTILETLLPALLDYGGEFLATGTPERKQSGLFYDVSRPDIDARRAGWEHAHWTLMANPFWGRPKRIDGMWFVIWGADDEIVSGPHELAELELAVIAARHTNGILGLQKLLGGPDVAPLDSPIMRRQGFGEWVREDSNYVYAVNKVSDDILLYADARHREDGFLDVVRALRDLPFPWQEAFFALGCDLGYNDPFGLVLWSWHPHDPCLYEVGSFKRPELDSDDQNACINAVRAHVPIGIVDADAGGLGKQVVKGWSKQWVIKYGLPIFEAEKQHKNTAIKTFNTDVLRGRIKFRRNGQLIKELRELQWATIVSASGQMIEDPTMPNELCDAGLYSHRRSFHFRWSPDGMRPPPGTREHFDLEAAELEDDVMERAGDPWRRGRYHA